MKRSFNSKMANLSILSRQGILLRLKTYHKKMKDGYSGKEALLATIQNVSIWSLRKMPKFNRTKIPFLQTRSFTILIAAPLMLSEALKIEFISPFRWKEEINHAINTPNLN